VKYLFGVEVSIDRAKKPVFYSQANHIDEVLHRFHMNDCHGIATPEATAAETNTADQVADSSDLPYRDVVGALQ
jgi:hypothetical protein